MTHPAPSPDSSEDLARLLADARDSFERHDHPATVESARAAATLAEAVGSRQQTAQAYLWWGKALTWSGRTDEARDVLESAYAASRDVADPAVAGESLRYLSVLADDEGEHVEAEQLAQQALEVLELAGDDEGQALVLTHFATIYYRQGRFDEAGRCLEQALPALRTSGHRSREAVAFGDLATVAVAQGRLADARRWAEDAVTVAEELDDAPALATNLLVLGEVHLAVGHLDQAQQHFEVARRAARAAASSALEAHALTGASAVALGRGDARHAVELARRAGAAADQAAAPTEAAAARLALGYAHLRDGRPDAADAAFADAEADLAAVGVPARSREAVVGRAAAALARDDVDRALAVVAPLLDLEPAGLQLTTRPARVVLTVVDVLRRAGDPRAAAILERGREFVLTRAAAAGDEVLSRDYLAVPDHAALVAPLSDDG